MCREIPKKKIPPKHFALSPFYTELYFHIRVNSELTSPSLYLDVTDENSIRQIFKNGIHQARERISAFHYPSEQNQIDTIIHNIENYDFENGNLDDIVEDVKYLNAVLTPPKRVLRHGQLPPHLQKRQKIKSSTHLDCR